MTVHEQTKHSAPHSLTGYLYQCRLALLEFLKRSRNNLNIEMSIETLDDVVFDTEGDPVEIVQVKHHINQKANLTNASTDLWNTIKIWCDLFQNKHFFTRKDITFNLMTTETAKTDTAAYFLRTENRDINEAEKILLQTANESETQKNLSAYSIFCNLSPDLRREMLKSSYIFDACLPDKDIHKSLQEELYYACRREHIKQFITYLEGWWFKRVLSSIKTTSAQPILGIELDTQIDELRDQFKHNALPIHDYLKTAKVNSESYYHYPFVHQLELIDISKKRIAIAVNNYYRAYTQRSKWLREDLILIGDLHTYEEQLIEEWEIHFETMKEEIGEDATEKEKISTAREIYNWVEKNADIPIRKQYHEIFLTRGSYQMLSNEFRVGWHPDFKERLQHLLEQKGE